ncbi:MAG: diacylglycerol kinase family protein [Bacteroidota bacterium]
MKKRIRFIINPISGVGKKDQLPALIEKHLDHSLFDYDIIYTEYRKHAKTIAYESSQEGFDIVCAVGGDGSVHEVGTALIGTKTKLAILPAGSGNGLARHLKIPLKLKEAIEAINESKVLLMDTGLVNDKPFLGTGGYGFDALIAKKFDHYHTRGFWGYTKLVMKEYFKYKPITIKIELPNFKRELPVVLCTLANASEFGNGFCVSPNSNVSDGTFELCILKPFAKWKTPYIIYKFFRRTSDKSKYAEIIPFQKARIILNEQIAHYDGEPFDVRKELNIEVKPKSLYIIVGSNYQG